MEAKLSFGAGGVSVEIKIYGHVTGVQALVTYLYKAMEVWEQNDGVMPDKEGYEHATEQERGTPDGKLRQALADQPQERTD